MASTDRHASAEAGEVLSALGGLAARLAAERGGAPVQLAALERCLAALDRLVETVAESQNDLLEYARLCEEFQGKLLELAQSPALDRHLSGAGFFRSAVLPALLRWNPSHLAGFLIDDQRRRYQVFRAIAAGEGFTAESLMREHGLFYLAAWGMGERAGTPADEAAAPPLPETAHQVRGARA